MGNQSPAASDGWRARHSLGQSIVSSLAVQRHATMRSTRGARTSRRPEPCSNSCGITSASTYRKDKQQLRQAARPLSQERDAKIFLDTFDDVHRRHRTALRQTRWRLVRRILEKSSADITRRASRRASITRTLNGLAAVYRDSRSCHLKRVGFVHCGLD